MARYCRDNRVCVLSTAQAHAYKQSGDLDCRQHSHLSRAKAKEMCRTYLYSVERDSHKINFFDAYWVFNPQHDYPARAIVLHNTKAPQVCSSGGYSSVQWVAGAPLRKL